MNDKLFKQAYEKIKKANNVLLVGHQKPDGDSLSSICAFIDLLKQNKIKYTAYCSEVPPMQFNFLPHVEEVVFIREELNFDDFDLIIALDCGSVMRTTLDKEILSRRPDQFVIEFDHHPKMDDYADIELRYSDKASTTEVIYNFFNINKLKINKNVANCILTGLMTDTGNFLYPNTSDVTVSIASKMLLAGAKYPSIIDNTWRNKSLAAMKIWGKAISSLQINERYNIAISVVTHNDLKNSGASVEDFEGVSGFLSNLHGVKGLMLLREEENGKIKGSLRSSHPTADISKLARALGGGGHAKASGFIVNGRLEGADGKWRVV